MAGVLVGHVKGISQLGAAPECPVDVSTVIGFRRTTTDAALATFARASLVGR